MSDFDPRGAPFVQVATQDRAATQLIKQKRDEDFIPVSYFDSFERINAWEQCIAKCEKRNLQKRKARYYRWLKCTSAYQGHQAKLFSQTEIGVPVPNFYAEGSESKGNKHGGNQQNT